MISILSLLLPLLCLTFIARRCWHVSTSPLNSAKDAHCSVKFCGAWIWWKRVLEQDAQAVHHAHHRLGPVVRLGPHELSINDLDGGLKPIYDGRLPKNDFYQIANSYGEKPMVALRDEESHRHRKRMLAKPYGKSQLLNDAMWHAEQDNLAKDLTSAVERLRFQTPVTGDMELYDIFFAYSMSAISAYLFGRSGNSDLLHDVDNVRRIRESYFSERIYQFVGAVLPVPPKLLDLVGFRPKLSLTASMRDRCETAEYCALSEKQESKERQSVYGFMRQSVLSSSRTEKSAEVELSVKQRNIISSEMQDHFIAGVDTSLAALAACAYLISLEHHRHRQARLREEVIAISHSPSRNRELEQLPVLSAIIKEVLRLYPSAAGGLPRVTDKTVVLGPQGYEVTVPPGVEVHCQAKSLHQSGPFSADADSFRPERWLDASPEDRKEMDRWYWAFGSGSRGCVGEHLALSNLRVAIAAIWGTFETFDTERTRFTVSQGIIAMPLPADGDYIRLRVEKVGE